MSETKIDGQVAEGWIAEEATPGVLSGSPVFFGVPINEYGDWGSDITTEATSTVEPTRQTDHNVATGINTSGNFTVDTTNLLAFQMQGFLFADAYENVRTYPLAGTVIPITAVDGSGVYSAASGLSVFAANMLVVARKFGTAANNAFGMVTAADGTSVTTNITTVAEAAPPANAELIQVGYQFPDADVSLAYDSETKRITLNSTSSAFGNLDAQPGSWLFVGGDAATTRFTGAGYGYGRVKTKDDDDIVLEEVAFTGGTLANDTGTGKTIQIFAGNFIKNEKALTNIKTRTYRLSRDIGADADGMQTEDLVGSAANQLNLNGPLEGKQTSQLTFLCLRPDHRSGSQGRVAGTYFNTEVPKPYNTSCDIWRSRLALLDSVGNPDAALFAYVNNWSLSLNNNVQVNKAQGVWGGFSITAGNIDVTGNIEGYFISVAAIEAVKKAKVASFNVISASGNQGMVYDIPALSLQSGKLTIEKGVPIRLPVEGMGLKSSVYGHTISFTDFPYLPNVAMPTV